MAAVLADSLNVLSNGWKDKNSAKGLNKRKAKNTRINAAFLAGTDSTGGSEGMPLDASKSVYNGYDSRPRPCRRSHEAKAARASGVASARYFTRCSGVKQALTFERR